MDIRELSAEDSDRIYRLREDSWIGYDRAVQVRAQIESLLNRPKSHRPQNIALLGESNNGKTMLIRNFCRRHNPPDDPNLEQTILPALHVQTPGGPEEWRLYYKILLHLNAAGSSKEPVDSMLYRIATILKHLQTRILFLDDFFNAAAGTPKQRSRFLNGLRNLSTEIEIPIVIAGVPESLHILSSDPSIINRFTPVYLVKWKEDQLENFARLVLSLEAQLLLKRPCNLMTTNALHGLLAFSEGLIGEVVAILRLLAESAIRSGTEMIDETMITKKNLARLGWVAPSDRNRTIAASDFY